MNAMKGNNTLMLIASAIWMQTTQYICQKGKVAEEDEDIVPVMYTEVKADRQRKKERERESLDTMQNAAVTYHQATRVLVTVGSRL